MSKYSLLPPKKCTPSKDSKVNYLSKLCQFDTLQHKMYVPLGLYIVILKLDQLMRTGQKLNKN